MALQTRPEWGLMLLDVSAARPLISFHRTRCSQNRRSKTIAKPIANCLRLGTPPHRIPLLRFLSLLAPLNLD